MATESARDERPRKARGLLRKVVTWGVLLFVVPAAVLVAAEGLFRVAGYGEARAPFLKRSVDGNTFYVVNPAFQNQFYQSAMGAEMIACPEEKKPDSCRILVVGGSAAQGWPDPWLAFHSVLELQLRAAYPGVDFQILNLAMAGLNIHVMRSIVEEAAPLKPDIVLVYCGNNEFIGPFGVDTAARQGHIPPANAIQRLIWLRRLRLVQWAEQVSQAWIDHQAPPEVDLFRDGLDWKPQIYENFLNDLGAICSAAAAMGATPILCTQAVNLREWPPYASRTAPTLSGERLSAFNRAYDAGRAAQEAGNYADALTAYREALAIDGGHADLHFRCAQCLLAAGEEASARKHFDAAAELDAPCFPRCRPEQNGIIRRAVEANRGAQAHLVDVAAVVAARSPSGVPGMEFFYDFCHTTFDGTYAVAMAVFDGLRPILPARVQERARAGFQPMGRDEVADLLGYEPEKTLGQYETIRAQGQQIPADAIPFIDAAIARLRAETALQMPNPERIALLEEALTQCGESHLLLKPLAGLLLSVQRRDDAASVAGRLYETQPRGLANAVEYTWLLRLNDQPRRAMEVSAENLALMGLSPRLLLEHIDACAAAGVWEDALESAELGMGTYADDPAFAVEAGLAHLELGQTTVARTLLEQVVQGPTPDLEAWLGLGRVRAETNDLAGAMEAFQQAIALPGGEFRGWQGIFEMERDRLDPHELVRAWESRVEASPGNAVVRSFLEEARFLAGMPPG